MSQPPSAKLAQPVVQPPVHRGLAVIDRALFSLSVPLLAARVPTALTTQFRRDELKNVALRLPRVQSVVDDDKSAEHRKVLLCVAEQAQLPAELVELLTREQIDLVPHTLSIDYDYWSADQILQAVLPAELLDESPTSFTQVGHIAHLNLRDEYLPHRHLIGQVILDKNKALRTVVNKLDTIDNTFRNFKMEVLAGDEDFIAHTSESGCNFKFDFSKVYWNTRLQGEHARLVESFSPTDVVVDAFAGVGPFAIPAGKKGCGVLASDLNPASAEALAENAKANKVESTVRTANEDARAYIRQSVLDVWKTPFPAYAPPVSKSRTARRAREATIPPTTPSTADSTPPSSTPSAPLPVPAATPVPAVAVPGPDRNLVNHFVMNLPDSAIEFLDTFRGLYNELYLLPGAREAVEKAGEDKLPMVHCYCFTKDVEHAEEDILARATKSFGMLVTTEAKDYKLRFVRDVAPKKEMYCLEFRLSKGMVE